MITELKPTEKEVWEVLDAVPDPEIPVISVVELGIVRDVEWNDGVLDVTLTPTYSGCPATAFITLSVEAALITMGLKSFNIISQLTPPWTTDWISQSGRENLKAYGIAPPVGEASCAGMLKIGQSELPDVNCPRCNSSNTERVSQSGSTPCKASYRCTDCLEPFDYFKTY